MLRDTDGETQVVAQPLDGAEVHSLVGTLVHDQSLAWSGPTYQ
jgi:hypothetical protein